MLDELGWQPLSKREKNRLTLMYKILNGLSAIKATDYTELF